MAAHPQSYETRKKISKTITGMKRKPEDLVTLSNVHRHGRPGLTKYLFLDETLVLEFLEEAGYIDENGTIQYDMNTCLPYRKLDLLNALKQHFLEYSVKAIHAALERCDLSFNWHREHLGKINYERSIMFEEYKAAGGELGYFKWLTQVLHSKK